MDKKIYEVPEVEVTEFSVEDVIATSEPGWGGGRV